RRRSPQNIERLNGKILRITPDGDVPPDNPFPDNYVWSYGHRNPQGLIFDSNGNLFASEHGSNNDDEINLIVKGGNYGFPKVQGYCDERSEKKFCQEHSVVEPLKAFTPCIGVSGMAYFNHPSIPEWKNSLLVATLKSGGGELGQRLFQCRLNAAGNLIESVQASFSYSFGRLRDVLVVPDGRIYLCTSNRETNANGKEVVSDRDDIIVEIKARHSREPI
ncbi:MAG: PQQ-dependent sugar dehydrogenase, partial [Saprospiraceae bacterium]|nr:PQQ-dependent sugar dehydrogenase [Saprospiraceae bacterium]